MGDRSEANDSRSPNDFKTNEGERELEIGVNLQRSAGNPET
jgi:hypothetical protein